MDTATPLKNEVKKALIEMVNAANPAKLKDECKRQHIKLRRQKLKDNSLKEMQPIEQGQSIVADSETEKVKEDFEENNNEPSSTLASSEESTVVMAETDVSEKDVEDQERKETNLDTIMQTSSDEEVKSKENDETKMCFQTANVKESSNYVNSKADEKQDSAADEGSGMKAGNSDIVSEMQKRDGSSTEFVRPLWWVISAAAIYASEEEAKDEHFRTPMHHQKLKEQKERNSST